MPPLVNTWPYGAVFWLVFLWAYWPELGVVWRARGAVGAQDAGSMRVIAWVLFVGVAAAFALAYLYPAAAIPAPRTAFWAGVVAVVAASLLRRHCFRMLGESFTGAVIVRPRQAIVERGAYRFVRHPSYTAAALMIIGIGLALANWAGLLTLVVAVTIAYGYRVSVEERALLATLGDAYRDYMSRTKKFIPFVL
jgi:protein-S-isoprenylcysteine O-methyltransferase Ste14